MSGQAGAPQAPWLLALAPAIGPVWSAWQQGSSVAQALNDACAQARAAGRQTSPEAQPAPSAAPQAAPQAWPEFALDAAPRFVAQSALPPGEAYEAFIHRTAQVPTRDNLHDLFNGLVWFSQPALKHRLNALQAQAIAAAGVGPHRGPLRDALTLMDENGALLQATPALWQALVQRDWTQLFITQRALWQQARLTVVGHALLEQLASRPRKPLTAHVLLPPALIGLPTKPPLDGHLGQTGEGDRAQADHWESQPLALNTADWVCKPFTPLPVLGVPGWWPANAEPGFYADAAVFRPPRSAAAQVRLAAQAGR